MLSTSGRSWPLSGVSPLFFMLTPLVVLAVWRLWPQSHARGIAAAVCGGVLFYILPQLVGMLASFYVLQ